jgi:hypothetical protein
VAFLEAISAKDLGIFLEKQDFIGVQDASEETRQEITWRGMFGTDGPAMRTVRHADEDTLNFTAIILKSGAERGLNKKSQILAMKDFDVQLKLGAQSLTYKMCNWTRVSHRATLTEVTLDCDISIPGYNPDFGSDTPGSNPSA